MSHLHGRNKWTFAIGTTGRDMVYTLISMYFIVYLTEVVKPTDWVLAWVSALILAARLFDAVMDIVMGSVVDNTRTRWGHYKPWIIVGMIASGLFTVLLVTHMTLPNVMFIIVFVLLYLMWSLSWTTNDIPYWSLMPALTLNQKEREEIGSLAKIFATIGTFTVVGTIVPMTGETGLLTQKFGQNAAWFFYALIIVCIMIAGQIVTLVGTKEPNLVIEQEKVTVKEIFSVVIKNDQLLWVAIAMVTFMAGYITTTTFGVYFFKYAYRNEDMYTPFGIVMGVSMITGYLIFPFFRKRFNRRILYTVATSLVAAGYILFWFAPMNMIVIGVAGMLLFLGDAWITILMLMFIADTIDYGHWKLGRRNTAITFALQPFINKVGAALATQIVTMTLIWTGINAAPSVDDVTASGIMWMKAVMLIAPLILTLIGYGLYIWKYKINEAFHKQIISELRDRGQLTDEGVAASQKEE